MWILRLSRKIGMVLSLLACIFFSCLSPICGDEGNGSPENPDPGKAGGEAVEEAAEAKAFVGVDACLGCHSDKAEGWKNDPHQRISRMMNKPLAQDCESCHGPGSVHVENGGGSIGILNPESISGRAVNNLCLKCHEKDSLIEARASLHLNEELSCLSCHSIHENQNHKLLKKAETNLCKDCHAQQVMETRLFARHPVREGQMSCTSCHNPHNSKDKMLLKNTTNQLCAKCHNRQSGPFVYDHPPATDGCLTCHKAHGSQTRGLLETRVPLLCFRCHGNTMMTHEQSIASRQRCVDCHVSIHGSNNSKRFLK